jgi:hypothetical protein
VIGTVPLGWWETITFVAALRHNKMTAPMVIEGAMTGEMFLAYVEQCLVPTLRRNDIVVMDNCRVHMAPAIRQAIDIRIGLTAASASRSMLISPFPHFGRSSGKAVSRALGQV